MLPVHRDVARIVLEASAGHAALAALGGGNALLAHGVSTRPTEDVDVFVGSLAGFGEVAAAMSAALADAGYTVEEHDESGGLEGIWEGLGEGLAELQVTPPGSGDSVQVQASFFELLCPPVEIPGIGLVVHLDDAGGWKAAACAGRQLPRDYCDIASLGEAGYDAARLIRLARERDQGLELADFVEAARHLDELDDADLAPVLPAGRDAAWVRAAFADWPRAAPPRKRRWRSPW
jgi:hypothetical protein